MKFGKIRSEMKDEFANVRSEMKGGFAKLRTEQILVRTLLAGVYAIIVPAGYLLLRIALKTGSVG